MTFVPEVASQVYIGGVHSTRFNLKAGIEFTSAKHTQDHMGLLASGDAVLISPTGETLLVGPTEVSVPAHTEHRLRTLTDCVWFCIHRGKR